MSSLLICLAGVAWVAASAAFALYVCPRLMRLAPLSKRAVDAVKKPSYDGLLWAKKPKSQMAMNMVADGKKNSSRFPALAKVFDQLVIDGVCSTEGKLIHRWDQLSRSEQANQLRYMRETQGDAFAQQVKAKVVAAGKARTK